MPVKRGPKGMRAHIPEVVRSDSTGCEHHAIRAMGDCCCIRCGRALSDWCCIRCGRALRVLGHTGTFVAIPKPGETIE